MRVPEAKYRKFIQDFYKEPRFVGMRFGQAFMSECLPGNYIAPDLFYEEDTKRAMEIIHEWYIDFRPSKEKEEGDGDVQEIANPPQ